jgi:hypothetical protein
VSIIITIFEDGVSNKPIEVISRENAEEKFPEWIERFERCPGKYRVGIQGSFVWEEKCSLKLIILKGFKKLIGDEESLWKSEPFFAFLIACCHL